MDTQNNQTQIRSNSFWSEIITNEKPGLIGIALLYCLVTGALVALLLSYYNLREGIASFSRTDVNTWIGISIWAITLWPVSALVSHLLAGSFRKRAPFAKLLSATGKAWLIQLAIMVVGAAIAWLMAWSGRENAARIWIGVWPFCASVTWWVYPFALRSTYGADIRAGLITFVSLVAWLIFAVIGARLLLPTI
jgi:hypothetical protein